jgi:hypothetical protein
MTATNIDSRDIRERVTCHGCPRSLTKRLKITSKVLEVYDRVRQLFFYFVTLGVQFDTLRIDIA